MYEERDEEKRAAFVETLKENASRGEKSQPVVYVDESGIHNNIRREYGWGFKGETLRGEKKSRPTEKLNLIAGLFEQELIAPLAYQGSTNTDVFNRWVEQCLIPVLPPHSLVVMDNASFHKSEKTREIIAAHGHTLLFLPPYSPDLNPIEHSWALVKRKLKTFLPSFETLLDALFATFQTL